MPQPLTPHQQDGTTGSATSLAERPECAALIGLVANAWAWLEYQLGDLFEIATAEIYRSDGHIIRRVSPIAIASFGTLESLSARLGVIEAALELMLPKAVPGFASLTAQIRSCARGRNQVVHSGWGVNEKFPRHVIRMPKGGVDPYIKWTPKDFQREIDQILAQSALIGAFKMECMILMREKLPLEPS